MFTKKDLTQIEEKGIELSVVKEQIKHFEKGFPYMQIKKPATIGDGILNFSDDEVKAYMKHFDEALHTIQVLKFVPASGAASRMFSSLFEYINNVADSKDEHIELLETTKYEPIIEFINNLNKFAFYKELDKILQKNEGISITTARKEKKYFTIIKNLLDVKGLNYGNLPKGLLLFHRHQAAARTPLEEHLVEGAHYGNDMDGLVQIHFTISHEHRGFFNAHLKQIQRLYEEKYWINYEIFFSEQKSSTDTIAVDEENKPFRNEDGSILFRPGGHGSLIENLNDINLDVDIIFIKNIDNVVPDKYKKTTFVYKKALSGVLFDYQKKIFAHTKQLISGDVSDSYINEVQEFIENKMFILPPTKFAKYNKDEKIEYFVKKLDRPIRVCGMVKNEGEPGGGPFWAINKDGSTSLQIVEGSQIDPEQKDEFLKNATHFNPVDLVISVRDHIKRKFNLLKYIDHNTGFISEKTKDGKKLKAQELPGLWNGAMADWTTFFVEVPIDTFNPVKAINDLLREKHQA